MKRHLCFLLLANLATAQAQGTFSDWFTKPSISMPVVLVIAGLTGACSYWYGRYKSQNNEIEDIKRKLEETNNKPIEQNKASIQQENVILKKRVDDVHEILELQTRLLTELAKKVVALQSELKEFTTLIFTNTEL